MVQEVPEQAEPRCGHRQQKMRVRQQPRNVRPPGSVKVWWPPLVSCHCRATCSWSLRPEWVGLR